MDKEDNVTASRKNVFSKVTKSADEDVARWGTVQLISSLEVVKGLIN